MRFFWFVQMGGGEVLGNRIKKSYTDYYVVLKLE